MFFGGGWEFLNVDGDFLGIFGGGVISVELLGVFFWTKTLPKLRKT